MAAFLSYDLPAELQGLLASKEEQLSKTLRDMTLELSNVVNEHYETLMFTRLRDINARSEVVAKDKEKAEADLVDVESGFQKHVEREGGLKKRLKLWS